MSSLDIRALPDACIVGLDAADADGVLGALGALAIRTGHAREGYTNALIAREHSSPTGLPTPMPVAIPHADAEHVLHGGFAVATLARPVYFGIMGTADERLELDVVVVLLVTDPQAQIGVLTTLIDIFQRTGWDASLRAATTPAALASAFDRLLEQP